MKRIVFILLCLGVLSTMTGCYVAPYPSYPAYGGYVGTDVSISVGKGWGGHHQVAPQLTVVSTPSCNQALERMRGTPALRGWCPTRRGHMQRQQFPDRPAMIRDTSGHRWCDPATSVGQTRMRCAKIVDRTDQIHTMPQCQSLACQRPATTSQGSKPFTERRIEPFDVCRVDHPVALRATSERLDACRRAIHNAALRVNDATTLVALDHLGDQDVAPGPQPWPPALPRVDGIAKGFPNGPDVGHEAIGTDQ